MEQRQMIAAAIGGVVLLIVGILIGLAIGGGGDDDSSALATRTTTATVRATSTTTRTPTLGVAPTAQAGATTPAGTPTLTPEEVAILRALQTLPPQVRQRLEGEWRAGTLTLEDIEAVRANLNNSRSATIIEADEDSVTARTFLGEQFTTEITEDTVIRRAGETIAPTDLKEDEIVLIFSTDGGLTAIGIEAFGVLGSDLP